VTGEWSENSTEVNRTIQHNYNYGHVFRSEDALRWQVENKFAKWAPVGSYIRYFTNDDMDESVRNISKVLDSKGVKGVDKAYFNLRPGAFRADVWRLLILWAEGGVYIDANVNLKCAITNNWIEFTRDELVVIEDQGVNGGYWNAMMAAAPHNRYIEHAIKDIVTHIQKHYYGENPLSVTGPLALGSSFRKQPHFPQGVRSGAFFKDGKAKTKSGSLLATKDENLHPAFNKSKHYDPMWRNHQVYCDQAGPKPDLGMCARK
jgi:hypothetical protein